MELYSTLFGSKNVIYKGSMADSNSPHPFQKTIFLFKNLNFDNCTFKKEFSKKDFDAQIPRCKQDKRRLENMLIFTKNLFLTKSHVQNLKSNPEGLDG
jgi:hypothetical protein